MTMLHQQYQQYALAHPIETIEQLARAMTVPDTDPASYKHQIDEWNYVLTVETFYPRELFSRPVWHASIAYRPATRPMPLLYNLWTPQIRHRAEQQLNQLMEGIGTERIGPHHGVATLAVYSLLTQDELKLMGLKN